MRKTIIALAALASLGAASTSAFAGYYGGYGYRSHYVPAYSCYVQKVWTYYGPVFKRVCH